MNSIRKGGETVDKWMNQGTTMRYQSVEGDISYCQQYTFDAIELKYNLIKDCNISNLKELIVEKNVKIGAIGSLCMPFFYENYVIDQTKNKLLKMCEIAEQLECMYITLFPSRGKTGNKKNVYKMAHQLIADYIKIVERYNVCLAFEVMGFKDSYINDFYQGLEIIRDFHDTDKIKMILDCYHYRGMNLDNDSLQNVHANEIAIVHINDGMQHPIGVFDDDERLWPGEGELDSKGMLHALKLINYDGPVSIEVFNKNKWDFDMEECYRLASEKMDSFLNNL